MTDLSLRIGALSDLYNSGQAQPADVIAEVYARIAGRGEDRAWIHLVPREAALETARALSRKSRPDPSLPLYGIPFAVKDNIDVEGLPTTAGCPAFRYTAASSANAVERLLAAGAIVIGKTNLDQFATGLVGTRSPYGVPKNPFDERYIPGGSSSGSAVAVASGLVSFALGTDTAGSGRVPAAFNNIVGLKPTRGFLSTHGVVPACRTLDCVTVFTLTCDDAAEVASVLAGYDPKDPFSRSDASKDAFRMHAPASFRFGIPDLGALEFFGDTDAPQLFQEAAEGLAELGGRGVEIDYAPLREAACLLYQGPWVAERLAALRTFFESHWEDVHPVTRGIIEGAKRYSAADYWEAAYRLAELKRRTDSLWEDVDVILLPTAGRCFTIDEVLSEPVLRNTDLGYYTNFVNLLDMCATAVPAGFCRNTLPFGVTLLGRAGRDGTVLALADRLHCAGALQMGATQLPVPLRGKFSGEALIAVVGAHLRGMPLNAELREHGGQFVRQCQTAPEYRLYQLPALTPSKPGLVHVSEGGVSIELEVWRLPIDRVGEFFGRIPAPLSIGTIHLSTGELVKGFLCEPIALQGAVDISTYGGWRRFMSAQAR